MKTEKFANELAFRRFLLGEMSAIEREKLEEDFITNEHLFDELCVVEDELIESYVRGTLSPAEKLKFEASFLTTPKRRERIAFAREMFDKLPAAAVSKISETVNTPVSVWDSIAAFFRTPVFAFSALAAILLLVFGGWFLLRNPNRAPEIVQEIKPTPTVAPQNSPIVANSNSTDLPIVANSNERENVNKPPAITANQNKLPPEVKPKPIFATLVLVAGAVRANGKMNLLNLPKDVAGANLQLKLESQDYKFYRAEIVDPDGNRVFQSGKLNLSNSKINLSVPAAKLRSGDYIIKLSGQNPAGENESVADYAFRVNQK